jgi:catechol 2,3-dioxygenase-like lactoylglutathione lyase family enzyme
VTSSDPVASPGFRPAGGRPALRLWFAIEVLAFDETVAFYRDVLGLQAVDGWSDAASTGVVFAIGDSARIEIESADVTGPPPNIALELPNGRALADLHARLHEPEPIVRHPRGHQGFSVRDPSGTEIYLWSEK